MKTICLLLFLLFLGDAAFAQEFRPYFVCERNTPAPLPDSLWKLKITCRDIPLLHFRLYRLEDSVYQKLTPSLVKDDWLRTELKAQEAFCTWEQAISPDSVLHTEAIGMPALKNGNYILSVSAICGRDTLDEILSFYVSPDLVFSTLYCRQIIDKYTGEIHILYDSCQVPEDSVPIRTLLIPSSPVWYPQERLWCRSIPYTGNATIGYRTFSSPGQAVPETNHVDLYPSASSPYYGIRHHHSTVVMSTSVPVPTKDVAKPYIAVFTSHETYSMGDTIELKGRLVDTSGQGIPHIEIKGTFDSHLCYSETQMTDAEGYFRFLIPTDSTRWAIYENWRVETFRCNDINYSLKTSEINGHRYQTLNSITLREKGCRIFVRTPSTQFVTEPFAPSVEIKNFKNVSVQIPVHVCLTEENSSVTALNRTFRTPDEFTEYISRQNLPQGKYHLHLCVKDKRGHSIRDTLIFKRINPDLTSPLPEDFYYFLPQKTFYPGDSLCLVLGSRSSHLQLTVNKLYSNSTVESFSVNLHHEQRRMIFPSTPQDADGYTLQILGFQNNVPINISEHIRIRTRKNPLSIKIITPQKNVQPDRTYKMKFRVTDSLKRGVRCEVIAIMYDERREQGAFRPQSLTPSQKHTLSDYMRDNESSFIYDNILFPVYTDQPKHFTSENPSIRFLSSWQIYPPPSLENQLGEYRIMSYSDEVVPFLAFDIKHFPKIKRKHLPYPPAGIFFEPLIKTNSRGYGTFEYELPDSVRQVHVRLIAYTPEMAIGIADQVIGVESADVKKDRWDQ